MTIGPKTVDGSKIHQWKGVLLPTCENNLWEDLHHDGSAIMCNGITAITIRGGTRGLQADKMDEGDTDPTDLMKVVLSGKQHPPRCTRGYLQVLHRKTRIHPAQGQQNSHTKMCQLRTGACHHQSALPKETGSHEQSKDFVHTSNKETYNQTRQQKASPHSIDKRMGHNHRKGSGKNCNFQ